MPIPLVIPADLRSQVAKVARRAKAKQAEVYRLAIRCGLKEAEQPLVAEPDRLFPISKLCREPFWTVGIGAKSPGSGIKLKQRRRGRNRFPNSRRETLGDLFLASTGLARTTPRCHHFGRKPGREQATGQCPAQV